MDLNDELSGDLNALKLHCISSRQMEIGLDGWKAFILPFSAPTLPLVL